MKKSLGLLVLMLSVWGMAIAHIGDDFYENPLLLNGRPLDLRTFSVLSKGTLTMVKGDPYGCNMPKVPFVAYLKRGNQIVNEGASSSTQERFQLELGPLMNMARFGDELVIEPTRPSDQHAKKVIKLTKFLFNIFELKKENEC